MICAQLEVPATDDDRVPGDCSWRVIIGAIRCHAVGQPPDVAADLKDWAELLEGLAVLNSAERP